MASKNQSLFQAAVLLLSLICVGTFPFCQAINGQMRIVGGDEVKSNEINYQASIRVYDQHICGGTIIGPNYILTAAHCFYGLGLEETLDDILVVTGGIKLQDTRNTHAVAKITLHKDFTNDKETSYLNDIAILTLEDQINFDHTQAPARLPVAPVSKGLTGTVIGWGRQDFGSPYLAKILRKATLKVLTWEECQPKMKFNVYNSQICGFAAKNTGICKGDSGGPLMVDGTVIGISSWNIPCATGVPDVFTNVFYHLDFIIDVMGSGEK
ncbi:chymotrypsin-2-like [Episyrphus balteatus]|uniref:chymotrypsin-2-like n=1 Tax=Episyrphus balteatus TaxID=286459 RepID=UPI002485633C|nr:chymotrypsin-2-like [Episyrphus balteatus]